MYPVKKRHLKVRKSYYDYTTQSGTRPKPVPLIELKGYWLEQAGFRIGGNIQISLEINRLLITTMPDISD